MARRSSVLQRQSPEEIAASWSRLRSTYLDVVKASKRRKGMEARRLSLILRNSYKILEDSYLFLLCFIVF